MAAIVDITNKTFGKLTVISRAKSENRKVRWLCKCECGNEIIVFGRDLKNGNIHSCGCTDENEFNDKVHHMSEQELKEWNELYEYVRIRVMGYNENTGLSRYMSLRLKGLASGKFIERKDTKRTANYAYKIVLNTFKYCALDIQKAISRKSFDNDEMRFRYIVAIVERNLSTVYSKMINNEKHNKELDNISVNPISVKTQEKFKEYQKKTQKKSSINMKKKFKDIW